MDFENVISSLEKELQFDAENEIKRICSLISAEVKRRRVHGVLIGLSGGLDSTTCAYLCARCLPASQIHLLSLPERDSNPEIHNRVKLAADSLNLPYEEADISSLFSQLGLYEGVSREVAANRRLYELAFKIMRWLSGSPSLYIWGQEYTCGERRGLYAGITRHFFRRQAGISAAFIFGKVRMRMVTLSKAAIRKDCLLICTTDRSEWSVGFYDPHGDGVGDIAPLIHLYKTQIRQLARALEIPDEILFQPSSGDLAAGLPNETALGMSYEKLDKILAGISLEMTDEEIALQGGVQKRMVAATRSACQLAEKRRQMPVRLQNQ